VQRAIRKLGGYGLAIVLVAAASLLTLSIRPVRLKAPFLLFTIAAMVTAAAGGFGPGIFAVLLSSFAGVFFLIEPIYSFRVGDPADTIPVILFAIVGVAIVWGVTLLNRARRQAEETRERFYRAFADAHIGFALVEAEAGIIEVNRAFCEITGHIQEELPGTELRAITHPEEIEESERVFEQLVTRRLPSAVYESRYLRKDGSTLWVRISAAVVIGAGGEAPNQIIMLVEDITRSKQLEQELRQAQRMEAVGRLAGGVAHDFNNLLTVIGGYGRMLLMDEAEVPGAMREPIRQIVGASDRAVGLTGQLLAFSRHRTIQPQSIELNGVVAKMEPLLKRLLGEDIELAVRLDSASGQILADPTQVEQVIMNLAVNARDAMPGGGRLTIETACIAVDEALASRHIGLTPGDHVLLTVTDNGSGMTAEVQAHLFEPFFTTKALGKGTGLGLSTVYGIVQQQGGKILVSSEVGQGTTFELFFPRLLANGKPQEAAPAGPAPRPGKETILVVEDEEGVREYVMAVLGQQGYTLLEAADGAQALEVVGSHIGEIDLLLSDVIMPQMNGMQLASRLRALRPGIKVLYMSGYTDVSVEARPGPGEATIQKPFSPDAIAGRVREVLDQT
jgi:PAS domain S-box-containing protein